MEELNKKLKQLIEAYHPEQGEYSYKDFIATVEEYLNLVDLRMLGRKHDCDLTKAIDFNKVRGSFCRECGHIWPF